ncbi:MAG: hypothetical protein E7259_03530 [Lachnospiraceae bacterium]|nr:hypothetical protein [Lachnospiraceae bacterium]
MAKNNIDDKEKDGKIKGSWVLIIILMITTFVSVMALLIKCDVGGFGSSVLRPIFKDVPVIKNILPPPSDEEVAIENDYPYDTLEEALAQVAILDEANAAKDAEIVALNDKVLELQAEVERLSAYELAQTEFEQKKDEFYDEIVYGESAPDTDTYIEWYNEIDAEHAEEIYAEIIEANMADQEIIDLAKAYEAMDPADAAEIFESMSNDLDTVALIMNNMSTDAQGEVLAEMSPEFAASVSKKLLP